MYKKWHKFLCFALVLTLFCLPVPPVGAAEPDYGYKETFYWNNFLYGVETTSTDYSYVVIYGYNGNEKEVTVPAEIDGLPVEYIDNLGMVVGNCPERLVISEGVKAIRMLFGLYDTGLQEVVLPSTLKVLGGSSASEYWHSLEERYFSSDPFAYAASLKTLKVPHSVALMSQNTFHESIILQVEAGSYAARWAEANGQPYEIIEHEPSVGDYDADGLTTTTDARLLLQAVADKVTLSPAQAAVADVDGDGETTATDARLILQQVAGKAEVDTLTCPLTFDSPLIPRESVADAIGWVREPSESGAPYKYTRAEGPLINPARVIDYLNACVAKEYHAKPTIAKKSYGAGVALYANGVRLNYQQNYALHYYGLMFTVGTGEQLKELIMA